MTNTLTYCASIQGLVAALALGADVCGATAAGLEGTPASGSTAIAPADFATRCAQPGVIKCVGFDEPSAIAGRYGDPSGVMTGAAAPAIDSAIKSSGAGSLRFTIPSNSPANTSGAYFTNFANDLSTHFDSNSQFYVQWRQRFSPELIKTAYEGGGGFKQIIIGTGDWPGRPYSSCSALEVVISNYQQSGFPVMYNSCTGSASHGAFDGFYERFGDSDFKLQNGRQAPYCLYSQRRTSGYFPPAGNCFGYVANEWMTFQIRIRLGTRVGNEFQSSHVTMWAAREGRPSELVIDWGPYSLTAGPDGENQRFGKVWLLPYNTGKDSATAHPVAHTWYDELIISRQRIADPK